MAHRLLKNAGITPAWIAEGRDLDRDIERLRANAGPLAPASGNAAPRS